MSYNSLIWPIQWVHGKFFYLAINQIKSPYYKVIKLHNFHKTLSYFEVSVEYKVPQIYVYCHFLLNHVIQNDSDSYFVIFLLVH